MDQSVPDGEDPLRASSVDYTAAAAIMLLAAHGWTVFAACYICRSR